MVCYRKTEWREEKKKKKGDRREVSNKGPRFELAWPLSKQRAIETRQQRQQQQQKPRKRKKGGK